MTASLLLPRTHITTFGDSRFSRISPPRRMAERHRACDRRQHYARSYYMECAARRVARHRRRLHRRHCPSRQASPLSSARVPFRGSVSAIMPIGFARSDDGAPAALGRRADTPPRENAKTRHAEPSTFYCFDMLPSHSQHVITSFPAIRRSHHDAGATPTSPPISINSSYLLIGSMALNYRAHHQRPYFSLLMLFLSPLAARAMPFST